MTKSHLKRINAPKTWPIKKKELFWITRPNPGSHTLDSSLPLNLIFRDMLGYADTTRETKKILNTGNILINGIPRKNPRFPVGIFDTISLPSKEYFRLLYTEQGKLSLVPIKQEETEVILDKITNKTILKNKKIQLNLISGKNILVEKDSYKSGDTLVLDKDNKIKTHLKLEKGAIIYLLKGKHISLTGKINSIEELKGTVSVPKIEFTSDKKKYKTSKNYAFVIGKDKPLITLPK